MLRQLSLVSLLLLCACESVIEVEFPAGYESKMVVDGVFLPDSTWAIHLSKSISYGFTPTDEDFAVEGATVEISSDQGYFESLVHKESGLYVSPSGYRPSSDVAYRLRAKSGSLPEVTASSVAPVAQLEIVEVTQTDQSGGGPRDNEYSVRCRVTDPEGRNYYRFVIWEYEFDEYGQISRRFPVVFDSDNKSLRHWIEEVGEPSSFLDDTEYHYAYFSDELFDGETGEFVLTVDGVYSEEFELELISMAPELFAFERSLVLQDESFYAAASRPFPVYSNIEGGLGVFAGYGVRRHRFGEWKDQ